MATTGFWPVKSRLKEVIDYAENPDKTIDKRYVDSDLYAALQYVSNDRKTDERMHVSGINCNAKRAYERMTATKSASAKPAPWRGFCGYRPAHDPPAICKKHARQSILPGRPSGRKMPPRLSRQQIECLNSKTRQPPKRETGSSP